MNRPSAPDVIELLDIIENQVKSKKAICPISASTIVELLSQSDQETVQATSKLIDELSGGIALIYDEERFRQEFYHFTVHPIALPDTIKPLDVMVWTKAAYALGFSTPSCP